MSFYTYSFEKQTNKKSKREKAKNCFFFKRQIVIEGDSFLLKKNITKKYESSFLSTQK